MRALALVMALAAPRQEAPFTLRQVAPGVYAAIDRDAKAGANAGFVIGDDAVAIVDAFQFPEAAELLLTEIRKLTPLPIRYVINTHYHIDHVAGDAVFRAAGALIVAQRNVAGWIRTENLKFFGADKTEDRARVAGLPLPDLLVHQTLTIRLGARHLELRTLPGHTGGDLVVAVPDAKVLFTGDLFWRRVTPSVVDATVSQWIGTLDGLEHDPGVAGYVYVPGQGEVATSADLPDFRHYLEDLTETVRDAMGRGMAGDSLVAAALPPLRARYASWMFFAEGAPREIPLMEAELRGTKRVPAPAPSLSGERLGRPAS